MTASMRSFALHLKKKENGVVFLWNIMISLKRDILVITYVLLD